MSAKHFLDTNVLVYTFDDTAPGKRETARQLVEGALASGDGIISYQVIQEFLNVATRKFKKPLTPADAGLYLDQVLHPLCEVFSSAELFRAGLAVADKCRLSFCDSLIVAAAQRSGCTVLYSEDLHHGQRIDGLEVVNPFLGPHPKTGKNS
jgi:predicted nucleic acid-binding protein